MARRVSGLLKAVGFCFVLVVLFMMTVSPARALSTACTALNAASPVSAGTSSYNASAFNADESVTVSFTDSGAGAGGTPMTADVVLLHSRDFSQHYLVHYSSDGNAGSFSTSLTGAQLTASGLYMSVKTANGFISPVTVSCSAAVTRSSDATLNGLSFSGGALSPTFSAATTSYHATVDYAVSSVTLTPVTAHAAATVTVNGSPVASGSASQAITLSVGANNIGIIVTAEDGTPKTYNVIVQRNEQRPVAGNVTAQVAANSNANPVTLALSGGAATSVSLVTPPSHGVVVVSGLSVTYTPLTGYTGSDSFVYHASNSAGDSADATVSLTILAPTTVTITPASGALPPATTGSAWSQTLSATGGSAPYTWTAHGLPAGITLNAATGALSGTPTTAGSFTFSVTVKEAGNVSATASYTLVVGAVTPGVTLAVTPAAGALPAGTTGSAWSQTFAVSGGTAPYRWQLSGALPAGLTFSDGSLKGTPTTAGSSAFTLIATDANGVAVQAAYTLQINAAAAQAADQSASLSAGRVTRVSLTRGASGGPFTGARLLAQPDKRLGTAAIDAVGEDYQLTFNAAPQASGTVALRYVLLSAAGVTSPATITLTIASRPDPSKDVNVAGTVSAQYQAAQNFARAQIRNFSDRLEQLHSSEDVPASLNGVHFALPTSRAERGLDTDLWNAALQQQAQQDAQDRLPPALPFGTQTPGQRLSWWTGGYVDFGRDKDSTMRLSHTLVGVSTGVDYRFTPDVTAGVGLGFGRDVSDIGDTGTRSNGQSMSTALYASYHPNAVFVDGLLGYSRLDFDSKRDVSETDAVARGSRGGRQFFGALASGYEFRTPQSLVSPYGRVQVSQTRLEGYTESDAGMYNLAFAPQRFSQVTGSAGLRAERRVPVTWGAVRLQSRVEYSRLMNDTGSARVGYADVGNDTWRMSLYEQNRQSLSLGAGLDVQLPNGVTPGIAYQGTLGLDDRGSRAQTIMARMNVAF
ncbi:autotransporter domain-containing protein [Cronobacter dublinensis]|nr:autotransporter domain-containing protein [Cronobacter dublinensis]EKF2293957.1 autotransporter domain-containing protein [Cronobacter dublinensis]EKF2298229.1 autotransporter domain-containing protein [Cronobacter dublinensis]EKK5269562.1 autotransporter domain-containing protein [Cronobacter dublinensis]EKM0138715.1 autotransporter domain-containing protein [Cronobacter dublinensis]